MKMLESLKWVKHVPGVVVAVVAVLGLILSLNNASRISQLSLPYVASNMSERFELDCSVEPVATEPFSISGSCPIAPPSNYGLWVVAVDGYGNYYPMGKKMTRGDGNVWRHDNVRIDTPDEWVVAIYLADANVTTEWEARSHLEESPGIADLPAGVELVARCENVFVRPAGSTGN